MQAEFIESAFKRRIKIILHLIKSTFRFAGQSHYQKCCRKGKIYTSTLKKCDKEGKEDKFQNLGSFRPPTGDSWQKSILRVHPQIPNLFLFYLQHQQEKYLCGRWNRECTLHVEHPSDIQVLLFLSRKRHHSPSSEECCGEFISASEVQHHLSPGYFMQITSTGVTSCNTCQCLLALK